jgi:predicted transcriptional regulator
MHAVDLDFKLVGMFVTMFRVLATPFFGIHGKDLLLVCWYHATTTAWYLTTSVSIVHIYPMKPVKAMTIRLSAEQAEALETVADVESRPVSEIIRAAIAQHIDSRKKDPAFQDSLKNRLDRARRLLRK